MTPLTTSRSGLVFDAPPRAAIGEAAGSAPPPARARGAVPWLVGLLVLVVGLCLVNHYPVGVAFDDGQYVILAKALATGQGFRWIQIPGAPAATHFPPGYPAVLALLWRLWPVFPANLLLFKAANALFLALAAVGVTWFARERMALPAWGAVALTLATTLGIPMLALSTMIMSEPLFLAVALATLIWAERVAERRAAVGELLLLGLAVGLASLVRTHGIAILGGCGLVLLLRRRWKDALLVGAGSALALAPWMAWIRMHEGVVPAAMRGNYESYTGWLLAGVHENGLALFTGTLPKTVAETTGMLRVTLAPSLPPALWTPSLIVIGAFFALGAWRLWRKAPVTTAFLAGYTAIVLLWPFGPTRFFWCVWPLVLALPVAALHWLLQQHPRERKLAVARWVAIGAGALLVIGHGVYTVRGIEGRWWSSITRQQAMAFRPMVRWVREHTAPNEVVASTTESVIYLYAGRLAVPAISFTTTEYLRTLTVEERRAALREILGRYPVSAVLVTSLNPESVREAAMGLTRTDPPVLVVRDSFPGGYVLAPRTPLASSLHQARH